MTECRKQVPDLLLSHDLECQLSRDSSGHTQPARPDAPELLLGNRDADDLTGSRSRCSEV